MNVCVIQGNRRVSLRSYLATVRAAKLMPGSMFKASLRHWAPSSGATIVREFREALHEKLSRMDPAYGVGRKWGEEWQVETLRAARMLNAPRVVIHWLPSWLAPRFAHRMPEREVAA